MSKVTKDQVSKVLAELRSHCGLFQRELKGLISQAEGELNRCEFAAMMNMKVFMKPFVSALDQPNVFELCVLESFGAICKMFPLRKDVVKQAVQSVTKTAPLATDQACILAAQLGQHTILGVSTKYTLNWRLLYDSVQVILLGHTKSSHRETAETITSILRDVCITIVRRCGTPLRVPPSRTITGLAGVMARQMVGNAVMVNVVMYRCIEAHDFTPTIHEAVVVGLFAVIAAILMKSELRVGTLNDVNDVLTELLEIDSPFYKTRGFMGMLTREIHMIIGVMGGGNKLGRVSEKSGLLKVIWRKYGGLFMEQLRDLLTEVMLWYLTSGAPAAVKNSLQLWSEMAHETQFFVDIYVTGENERMFEKLIGAFVKSDSLNPSCSMLVLNTIVNLLEGFWKYYRRSGNDSDGTGSNELDNQSDRRIIDDNSFVCALHRALLGEDVSTLEATLLAFSVNYAKDNTEPFETADIVYYFAFECVRLNAALSCGIEISFDEFFASIKLIGRFEKEFISDVYDKLVDYPIPGDWSSMVCRREIARVRQRRCYLARNAVERDINETGVMEGVTDGAMIGLMFGSVWLEILGLLTKAYSECVHGDDHEKASIRGFELFLHIASHCRVEDAISGVEDSIAKLMEERNASDEKRAKWTAVFTRAAVHDAVYLAGVWDKLIRFVSTPTTIPAMREVKEKTATEILTCLDQLDIFSVNELVTSAVNAGTNATRQTGYFSAIDCLVNIVGGSASRRMADIAGLWRLIGGHFVLLASSPDNVVGRIGIEAMMRALKGLLRKEEPEGFHFQEFYLSVLLEAFQAQPSSGLQVEMLGVVAQLSREFGVTMRSGWIRICQILSISTLEPETQKKAFDILRDIRAPSTSVMYIIDVVPVFAKNAGMKAAPGLLLQISQTFDIASDWKGLFSSVARCAESRDRDVQKKAQDAFLVVLENAVSKGVDSDILRFALVAQLPTMFVLNPVSFVKKLVSSSIANDSKRSSVVLDIIGAAVMHDNQELSNTAITMLVSVVKKHKDKHVETVIEMIANKCSVLALPNALAFIRTIAEIDELLGRDDICPKTMKLITSATEFNAKACNSKYSIIYATASEEWVRWIKRSHDAITLGSTADIITHALRLFTESDLMQIEDSEAGKAWLSSISVHLSLLSSLDDSSLLIVWPTVGHFLVRLILVSSRPLRDALGFVIQRHLVLTS